MAPTPSPARRDVTFASGHDTCAAWLYEASKKRGPVIVLAHGLGGVKEMRLDACVAR